MGMTRAVLVDDTRESATRRDASILVVDDNRLVTDAFSMAIRRAQLVPVVGSSLDEGRRLATRRFAGAVLDVSLPDGSGLDLIGLIRQNSRIPVLVVSGMYDADVINQTNLLGVEYACKPNLEENIRQFLGRCARIYSASVAVIVSNFASIHGLTPAECRLVDVAMRSCSHEYLVSALGVSEHTVKKHIAAVLLKTRAITIEQVVAPLRVLSLSSRQ